MKTENVVLMRMAQESLQGKWGLAIGTNLVYFLIISGARVFPILGPIASFIISGPMLLGISMFSLSVSREEEGNLEQLFKGFDNFSTALAAYFFMILFIVLWTLLLVIPGIIAAISYSMTFYIIADDSSITAMEAIDKSKGMMEGNKMKFFYLGLRFLGLALLCILTLGIGFLWLAPYVKVTIAKFYDDIKTNPISMI